MADGLVRQTWFKASRPIRANQTKAYIWANYNDVTATSLGLMVSKGNHPQMTLIQVSELL